MNNYVVKYHNDFQKVSLSDWHGIEQNILFSIFSLMKGKKTKTVEFPIAQIKKNGWFW